MSSRCWQTGQSHSPSGTAKSGGSRQCRWNARPHSRRSHTSSSCGNDPQPHTSHAWRAEARASLRASPADHSSAAANAPPAEAVAASPDDSFRDERPQLREPPVRFESGLWLCSRSCCRNARRRALLPHGGSGSRRGLGGLCSPAASAFSPFAWPVAFKG